MIGLAIAALIGLIIVANGILMLVDPRLWTILQNRVFGRLQGRKAWFELSVDAYGQPRSQIVARVGGGLMLLLGIEWMRGVLGSLDRFLRGAPVGGGRADSHKAIKPIGQASQAVFIVLIVTGFLMAVWPVQAAEKLGVARYLRVAPPTWVWRVLGIAASLLSLKVLLGG